MLLTLVLLILPIFGVVFIVCMTACLSLSARSSGIVCCTSLKAAMMLLDKHTVVGSYGRSLRCIGTFVGAFESFTKSLSCNISVRIAGAKRGMMYILGLL